MAAEEALKAALDQSDKNVKNMEHDVSVLKKKIDTDGRLHRQAAAAARREQDALNDKVRAASARGTGQPLAGLFRGARNHVALLLP